MIRYVFAVSIVSRRRTHCDWLERWLLWRV